LVAGHKVAGSAQRKRHGALLQHGGVLLAQSPHTPQLPGITELSGRAVTAAEWMDAATGAFARATGWELSPDAGPAEERCLASRLHQDRYCLAAWNERR